MKVAMCNEIKVLNLNEGGFTLAPVLRSGTAEGGKAMVDQRRVECPVRRVRRTSPLYPAPDLAAHPHVCPVPAAYGPTNSSPLFRPQAGRYRRPEGHRIHLRQCSSLSKAVQGPGEGGGVWGENAEGRTIKVEMNICPLTSNPLSLLLGQFKPNLANFSHFAEIKDCLFFMRFTRINANLRKGVAVLFQKEVRRRAVGTPRRVRTHQTTHQINSLPPKNKPKTDRNRPKNEFNR